MSTAKHRRGSLLPPSPAEYKRTLYDLRVQLVKLQNQVIRKDLRILVVLEGRDGAGKDGVIKRIVKNLSPRETRVVALGKPSDRDESGWYFQRYVPHLPVGGEIVLFNRSWYNRAGVEMVMGFCTPAEHESFLEDVPRFEQLLVRSGILLRKYYLDIGKAEQKRRLADRSRNPLKQWKLSPIDDVAVKNWEKYSEARDEMLGRTQTEFAPWNVVRTDDKRTARLNVIKSILASIDYKGKDERLLHVNAEVVFTLPNLKRRAREGPANRDVTTAAARSRHETAFALLSVPAGFGVRLDLFSSPHVEMQRRSDSRSAPRRNRDSAGRRCLAWMTGHRGNSA